MLDLQAEYEVIVYAVGDTKAGTKMGKLQLKNLEDESVLNCVLWEEALNRLDAKLFRCGNILKIISGTYNEKFNNCNVTNLKLIYEAKMGLSEPVREEHFEKIVKCANEIKNQDLKNYILNLLKTYEKELKIAPAAKMHHHNYIGGLIQHIVECLEFSQIIKEKMIYKISDDDIFGACILHDFGKIFEYKIDVETGLIDYDEDFRENWRTHTQWGYSNCMTMGFTNIAKMIAAHHSRIEWGAIIDLNEKNLEPMLYFIHHIDDLSAKFGKISVKDL